MEIDVTKCEYYTTSGGCMSNEKECWFECCSKNNNCKFVDIVNKTSISELGKVLKNCEALISVDTGTMHLGCAVRIPVCVVFYKPNMTNKWAPRKELYNSIVIQENQTAENIWENTKHLMENK